MTNQESTLHLGEPTHGPRQERLAALDTIESLNPAPRRRAHTSGARRQSPHHRGNAAYIRGFDRVADNTSAAQQLYGQMAALYRPASTECADKWHPYRSVATSYPFSATFEPAEAPPAVPRET
jgi:hypothetical protein